jgi:hypothetical protein
MTRGGGQTCLRRISTSTFCSVKTVGLIMDVMLTNGFRGGALLPSLAIVRGVPGSRPCVSGSRDFVVAGRLVAGSTPCCCTAARVIVSAR